MSESLKISFSSIISSAENYFLGDFLILLVLVGNVTVFDLPIGAPQPLNVTFFFVLLFTLEILLSEFQTFYLGEKLCLFCFSTANNTDKIII